MISKEWREARWKFLIGVLAFLLIVSVAPRPYEKILDDIALQVKMMERELQSPEFFLGPPVVPPRPDPEYGYTEKQMRKETRDQIERMKRPGVPTMTARSELVGVHQASGFGVMASLAGLLGVALVSGEVSRGTIFLLFSRPVGRTRVLLTKYSVCVAVLFLFTLVVGAGATFSGYAHGYPSRSLATGYLLTSSFMFWLGALFVLGVALLASVVFRDVIRSVIATALSLFLVYAGPDLLRGVVDWWHWRERDRPPSSGALESWYESVERFRLLNYMRAGDSYTGEWSGWGMLVQNSLVLLVAAALPLLAALWLFNRKAY